MRILNTQQIRELDSYTTRHEPVSSLDLMERASRAFVDWFVLRVPVTRRIGVVCGTGNNGGDGLAIARMLNDWSYPVTVWVVNGGVKPSPDFLANRQRLGDHMEVLEIGPDDSPEFGNCEVLIDALFGSGLSRPAEGLYAKVIHAVNNSSAQRIAVDIPSGLMADGVSSGPVVKAHHTVTFQLPKLAFLMPGSYDYTGEWEIVDIGLDKGFIKQAHTDYYYTGQKEVRKLLKRRRKNDHKGTFGHALLIAGSYGKMGAAVLAARAALRAGLGLLTVHIPQCGYEIIQTAVPEAMALVDDAEECWSGSPDGSPYVTAGIGPGLGQDARTLKALSTFLESFGKPVVLDADGLNLLAANRHLLNVIPPGSILTPHPKEFERLVGSWKDDFQRMEMQKQLATSLRAVVILKGAHTAVATPEGKVHFNSSGNPGMGTAGTGDILTGVLTGMLAQKYSSTEAAVAGVFLHGLAGDLAKAELGMDSLIASDLIAHLGAAFMKTLRK